MKSIYTHYKERLIEISGRNRSLYVRSFSKKTGYDIGRLLSVDGEAAQEFVDFLWAGGKDKFTVISPNIASLKKLFGSEENADPAARKAGRPGLALSAALEKEASAL